MRSLLLLFFLAAGPAVHAQDALPGASSLPGGNEAGIRARAGALAAELRCPVCQGLSAADSQAEAAVAMRTRVEQLMREGRSDEQIRAWFVDRYGEWVLLEPPRHGRHWIVWLGPLVLLLAGAGVVARRMRIGAPRQDATDPGADLPADLAADPWVQRVLADLERR